MSTVTLQVTEPKPFKKYARAHFAATAITDTNIFGHLMICAVAPYSLCISQHPPATKGGRIAHQQQFAPCAGHAHVHAADVGKEADFALGVAARQGDGNDVALLALKRIDGAHAEPALQQQVIEHFAVLDGVF